MKIAVINDLSGMGRCSLTVSLPVLSVLGHTAYPVPTAILSNQTGYSEFSFFDFTDHMDEYVGKWIKNKIAFDVVYSGFLANEKQAEQIDNIVENCGKKGCKLVVDPVMGDGGQMYATFDDKLCEKVKGLVKKAYAVTPNFTEACLLTQTDYEKFSANVTDGDFFESFYGLAEKVQKLGPKKVVLTGVERDEGKHFVYNFILDGDKKNFTKNLMYGGHYSGTGDMLASVVAAGCASDIPLAKTVSVAADFIEVAVKDAFLNKIDKNDGVNFEKFLRFLSF